MSSDSLPLFKLFMEEPRKVLDDSNRELLTTLGLLGTSAAFSEQSSNEEDISGANNDDDLVIECDWVPQYEKVDSINRSASNNNNIATDDHKYSHIRQFEQVSEEDEDGNVSPIVAKFKRASEEAEEKEDHSWTPNQRRIITKKKKGLGDLSKKRFHSCGKCINCRHNSSFKRYVKLW